MKLLLLLVVSAILCEVSLQTYQCILNGAYNRRLPGRGKRSVSDDPLNVYPRAENQLFSVPEIDEAMQITAIALAGEIPVIGGFVAGLVELFWPSDKRSVWEQVEEQVKKTVHAAFTQEFRDFWKYVQRELKTVMAERGRGLIARRYVRLHGLDQQLGAEEHKLKTRAKDHEYEVLLEYMPFATTRLIVLSELVCVSRSGRERYLSLQMYIHKLAEYVAEIPAMIEGAAAWRVKQFRCHNWSHWFQRKCSCEDGLGLAPYKTTKRGNARGCNSWCIVEKFKYVNEVFRRDFLAKHYNTLSRWTRANRWAKRVLQYYFRVKTYDGCYTDSRGTDYTGRVAKTKSGKPCKNWIDVTCKERKFTDEGYVCLESQEVIFGVHHYDTQEKLAAKFVYDGNGTVADPKNYCRNPAEPKTEEFKTPYCFTKDGQREDCSVRRCYGFNKPIFNKRMVEEEENGEI